MTLPWRSPNRFELLPREVLLIPRYLPGCVLLTCHRQAVDAGRVIEQLVDGMCKVMCIIIGIGVGGVVLCRFLLRRSTFSPHLLLEAFLDGAELSV